MTLSKLLKNTEIISAQGNIEAQISGIAYNSREVKPGDVFVCMTGFNTDGHKYIDDALDKGAVAIVVEKDTEDRAVTVVKVKNTRRALANMAAEFYEYPFKKFKLIGITGTNGKTTTTYLIKSILESCGQKVGLIGTNQNMIGDEVIPSHHTTPESLELMGIFHRMAIEGVNAAIMEVSSHSIALDRVAACNFDVAAFTNVTQDHLDFHKTMEEYIATKAKLFDMCQVGAVNIDDNASEKMLSGGNCKYIKYSVNEKSDIYAQNIEYRADGVTFDMVYMGKTEKIDLAIPGRFSVYNALTAAACCLGVDISLNQIAKGLKSATGVKGRIEVVKTDTDYTVIIDYAHTPDGMVNILNAVKGFSKGRIITLFGCGGDRDRTKRPQMGEIAGRLSDFCIITSDNPRSEEPLAIIDDIIEGIKQTDCEYKVIENRFQAIEYALDNACKDDIILLLGKGHEQYQILKDRTIVFDEREIVHKLIKVSER